MRALGLCLLLAALPVWAAEDFAYQSVDRFDDLSVWWKGDPNTDMTQAEVGVRSETTRVKEGKGALAFMVRVDWTPKPGEKYPKGWPMITRTLPTPQDWSAWDQVRLWVYMDTTAPVPEGRALGIGFGHGGKPVEDWFFPQGLKTNVWQEVTVPLDPLAKWDDITSLSFYVAEGWYRDKDRIDFLLDDMRLARRSQPALGTVVVSPGFAGRGKSVHLAAGVDGYRDGLRLRATVLDAQGKPVASDLARLEGRTVERSLDTSRLTGGSCQVRCDLVSEGLKVLDSATRYVRLPSAGKRPYLNLITFYTPKLVEAEPEKMKLLRDSAFDGVAMPVEGGYVSAAVPEYAPLLAKAQSAQSAAGKQVWPWIFLNRMIGSPEDAQGHAGANAADPGYFQKIKILDLDNAAGARAQYLALFRLAVRLARELKSPGIVLDLEAYNNYPVYNVGYVAERRGETPQQVIAGCEKLGADMARVCAEEYPACVVWSLFSRLETRQSVPGLDQPALTTVGCMSLGFLKYCLAQHLPTRYLCGGEDSVGYYSADLPALQRKITTRAAALSPYLEQFPANFELAGTISPYHDYHVLTSWLQKVAGADPQLKTIADFQPFFRTLFEQYDWVWIYAASAGKANPYAPALSATYSAVYRAAMAEACGGK